MPSVFTTKPPFPTRRTGPHLPFGSIAYRQVAGPLVDDAGFVCDKFKLHSTARSRLAENRRMVLATPGTGMYRCSPAG